MSRSKSGEKSAPAIKKDAMLPLDVPRAVALKSGSGNFIYHLRRVGIADWRTFYSSIVHQKLRVDGQLVEVFESESALVELVESALVRVEGYDGIDQVKKWKDALPLQHKLAVGVALRSVSVAKKKETSSLLCDLVEVRLDAAWATDGETMYYQGLVHRFRHPSIEQLKKFNFEAARVIVRGDGDNGISLYPSRQAIAMKIYDELIESVEGYSIGGVAISDVEAIKREMDGAHKATAALEMFATGEGVEIK
jgi:hypothetical protein